MGVWGTKKQHMFDGLIGMNFIKFITIYCN